MRAGASRNRSPRALLGVVVFVLTFLLVAWWFVERAAPDSNASGGLSAIRQTEVAQSTPQSTATASPTVDTAVQPGDARVATGTISFEGGNGVAPIEVAVKDAVGVWLPMRKTLRVALLRAPAGAALAASTRDALAQQASPDLAGDAILEIVFTPTAQGMTSDEIDVARVIAVDSSGRSVEADVRSSLQWGGGLPADMTPTANPIEMSLAGSGFAANAAARRQAWNLSIAVPVTLHE